MCGDHVRAVQQCHLDNGGDADGIDRMAGRKGRAGKTHHGVVHVEPVFEPGLSARQPSDALGIGHVAMRWETNTRGYDRGRSGSACIVCKKPMNAIAGSAELISCS